LSILPRISLVLVLLCGCSPEQSKNLGDQPKKALDGVSSKVGNLMQQGQGSERLKEEQK
jgi:hypothetical protein